MRVLDVFCGVGGLSWGFAKLGFEVVGGIDVEEEFLKVFSVVHENAVALKADVSQLSERELSLHFKDVNVVVGGPPCQAFSTAGKRALDDPRAKLVKEFVRVVSVLKPEAVVFENVRGFTSFAGGRLWQEVLDALYELSYEVVYDVVFAVNFSVPQKRERFVFLAVKNGRPKLFTRLTRKTWTFSEATSDLPVVYAGEEATFYATPPQNELQAFFRANSPQILTLHRSKRYEERTLKLLSYVPEGASAHQVKDAIPPELRPTSGFKNTYARVKRNEPAPTVTRNFQVVSSHACVHPVASRGLTPREAARLQSFPDDYPLNLLKGTKLSLAIGNAVPPLLGLGLALSVAVNFGVTVTLPKEVEDLWQDLRCLEERTQA